jgi:fructokinase
MSESRASNQPAGGPLVVGIGEALYDMLPGGPVLGGAPVNAAVQAGQLLALLGVPGGRAALATRVGDDDLGRRFFADVGGRGLDVSAVQVDDGRPTGTAVVALDHGEPSFSITADVAWDRVAFDASWQALAPASAAVCFGTLGRRTPPAARAIERFLAAAPRAVRLFDVNLRPPFFSPESLVSGCRLATMLKVNEQELPVVAAALGLPAAAAGDLQTPHLARQLEAVRTTANLEAVVLTRGTAGAAMATAAGLAAVPARCFPPRDDADTIGAGDAFGAAVVVGRLLEWPPERILDVAARAAGFVASQPGATPVLPADLLVASRSAR